MWKKSFALLKQFPSLLYSKLEGRSLLEETIPSKTFFSLLIKILQKWPHEFDSNLIRDAQRFLVLTPIEFRAHRCQSHQLRIICSHYLMRKNLLLKQKSLADEIQIELRLLPTRLLFPFGQQSVIGISIVIPLSNAFNQLKKEHILLGAKKLLPHIQFVKDSFLTFQQPRDPFHLLYLELEKADGSFFTSEEMLLLKTSLKEKLIKNFAALIPSILGLNDALETTTRNIFFLSQELQTTSDLPQVMISFEKTFGNLLVFRILIVRALKNHSRKIADYFIGLKESVEFILERSSIVGHIDNIPKEASVFYLKMPKKPFLLRSDFSFNLFQAHHFIFSLLTRTLGEVCDHNGKVFAKQLELFAQFKTHCKQITQKDPELLEDFFYGFNPPGVQAILPLESFFDLFQLYLEALASDLSLSDSCFFKVRKKDNLIYAIVRHGDPSFHDHMSAVVSRAVFSKELTAWVALNDIGGVALGYIHDALSEEQQTNFVRVLEDGIESWLEKIRSVRILRLSLQHSPISLDPRIGGDEISSCILKMLFEGLTRIGKDGQVHLAIATSAIISDEEKCYTFTLRNCTWSNGDPITAHDFCYTWKTLLSPHFNSPFAHFFHVILNAKKAQQGLISIEEIGVSALDDKTLVIQLEHPCPYFLALISHPLYSPINHRTDKLHPNWHVQSGTSYVCNGPFMLQHIAQDESYKLIKNPLYWDETAVKLDRILIVKADAPKAKKMFENGEIDWLGRPLRAWEHFFKEDEKLPIEKVSVGSTLWCYFNLQEFPFQSKKIRQAFAYAIDRQSIVNLFSYPVLPAYSPVPLSSARLEQSSPQEALKLFESALQELEIKREEFPILTLIYPRNELREKIALRIVQQWKEVLGIVIRLESYDFKEVFQKLQKGDYHIGCLSWRSWIDDPLYTLEAFKSSSELINFSNWKNWEFQALTEKAQLELDAEQRNLFLAQAEAILMQEMPVIPVFYDSDPFIRKSYVEGLFPSKMGNIDFKHVNINTEIKYSKKITKEILWTT